MKADFVNRRILRASLLAILVSFVGVVGLAVYAHNFVPGSYLLTPDELLTRFCWVTVASLFSGAIVLVLMRSFSNLAPKLIMLLVVILAQAAAILASVFYFHLRYVVIRLLHPPTFIALSGEDSLSLGEQIVTFLISMTFASLVLGMAIFVLLNLLRIERVPKLK